jgi:DNA polymerase III delta prime subunit
VKNHLWVETYAPQTIEDCILPETLKGEFLKLKELPNMLLIGEPGVGKTTVARVLCHTHEVDMMFMNASMENGIDEVRNKINQFASTSALFGGYKVVLLDEADGLSPDAQKSLRHLIEQYQANCRFILTCNFPWKIIDPLRSRLTEYCFNYPSASKDLHNKFIMRSIDILMKEKVNLKEKDVPYLQTLTALFYPNWRKAIHELQRSCVGGVLDPHVIEKIKGQHIISLVDIMKAKNWKKAREWVAENLAQGVYPMAILSGIWKHSDMFKGSSRPLAVVILARYQHQAAQAADQEVNTVACITELMHDCEFV